MKPRRKLRLVSQLLLGQIVLIVIAGFTLIGTAFLLAPAIFKRHMLEAGIDSSSAQTHMSEAFASAFSFSLAIAMLASFVVAGIIAWYLMRRISQPIESLAIAAENLSTKGGPLHVNLGSSTPEIDRLAEALTKVSGDLAKIEEDQSRMLRDLAHELRTPISIIGALVDGIEDGVVKGDAHSWNTIRDQLSRLNRLSRDVRNVSYSHEQTLNNLKVAVNPVNIARSAVAAWQSPFERKGVVLKLRYDKAIPAIQADPIRIAQVLSNLLENALRHTHTEGLVELIIDQVDGGVTFTVRDNGEGISGYQMPHIFNRLYRGDMARAAADSGSGLGLSIARNIAESHHGTLVAMSEGPGRGSSFILTIPLS